MTGAGIYLSFNGNCRQAMSFYRKCFGGKLSLQTFAHAPFGAGLPAHMKRYVLQATLQNKNWILTASDIVSDEGFHYGNTVQILLTCDTEEEFNGCYRCLAARGMITSAPQTGAMHGKIAGIKDPFGINWLLCYSKKTVPKSKVIV